MSHHSKRNNSLLTQIREEKPVSPPQCRGANAKLGRILIPLLTKLPAHLYFAIIALAVWGHAAAVFAQGKGKNQPAAPTGEKSYVLSYVIVVLCIALGLLVVCRSGGRSNEPKLDNLE